MGFRLFVFLWRERGDYPTCKKARAYQGADAWPLIKNYFKYRVTSAVCEGFNNVIKMLKRKAFGYRNMEYYRLKIMQVCGYLNSRFIPNVNSIT